MVYFSCSNRTPAQSITQLEKYFDAALAGRQLQEKFGLYHDNVAGKFQKSSGKCRLQWIRRLVGEPVPAVAQAERFTRELFVAAGINDLRLIVKQAANRLEAVEPEDPKSTARDLDVSDPLEILIRKTHAARQAIEQSFHSLSVSETEELRHRLAQDLEPQTVDLLERIDRRQLLRAAQELASLADPKYLEQLAKIRGHRLVKTPDGSIMIGDRGHNEYRLDELAGVYAIVDTGGDDVYIEGTTTAERPVLVILDLAGNDVYRGEKAGIQGGAIMGASLLVDRSGNDTYTGGDVAQGSALAGAGLLIDESGQDTYHGDRRVQGQAIAGCGILIDRKGDDRYRAALLAQGVGGPLGFGILVDLEGTDHYFAGGKYTDPYDDTPGYAGWSQGVGVGIRGVAEGGIGVLLDGKGNDTYEADYFSYGGGYWYGAGFARDFDGDDLRWGATRENFDGSPRIEPRYLRWGIAYGCHYAAGFVFDDRGNDLYHGDWAAIAYGWDFALAALLDFSGNDRYISTGSGVAEAHNDAVAILYDCGGDDTYSGKGLGLAEARSKYHASEKFCSSFAMLLDESGDDTYGDAYQNEEDSQRGWPGGFLIDR